MAQNWTLLGTMSLLYSNTFHLKLSDGVDSQLKVVWTTTTNLLSTTNLSLQAIIRKLYARFSMAEGQGQLPPVITPFE
jgi:hypothetical protein